MNELIAQVPGDCAKDFIRFLKFCSDRLNDGQTVQQIWTEWKGDTQHG